MPRLPWLRLRPLPGLLLGRQTSRLTSPALGTGLIATTTLLGLGMDLLALRRKRHDDVAAFLLRSEFDSAVFLHFAGETLQQLDAADRSGLLATAQHNGDLDLVSAVQEAHNMALLDLEVMVVDLQTEANFLDFRGALVAARLTSLRSSRCTCTCRNR